MAWTVQNVSNASVSVLDVPDPTTIAPGDTASFQVRDFLNSTTLASNVALGALCVVNYGDFAPMATWAPITYQANQSPSTSLTSSGYSLPFTLAPFSSGLVMLNVTALGTSSSVAIGFQAYDGTSYYPAQSVISAQSSAGAISQSFAPQGLAGRLTWTISGSATFSLLWQVR